MVEVAKGITKHTVVIVIDRRERSVAIATILRKLKFHVVAVQNLYEALKAADQELPHLIISDVLLSDGTAGTLYDRIQQNELLKNTPIMALVANKSKEQLMPLKGRSFAGFLLGKLDAQAFAAKVREIIASHSDLSPYFRPADSIGLNVELTVSLDAKVLGKSADQVVSLSESQIDSEAALVCLPQSTDKSPALFKMGSNVVRGEEVYNLFPFNRIKGKGLQWLVKLPEISISAALEKQDGSLQNVLFFDPNQQRFEQFREVLLGYQINLIQAHSLQVAMGLLSREVANGLACVYLDELPANASGIAFKEAVQKIPEAQRPVVIVGTHALNLRSGPIFRFIHKPFGLGILVDMMESAFQANQVSSAPKATTIDVKYQAPGKLIGLDETGGIIQTRFPVLQGTKVILEHDILSELWEGETLVQIVGSAPLSPDQSYWQAKFVVSKSSGNKARYWTKIAESIERLTSHEDEQKSA